ncbi:polysaccharide deacetylase family protein [Xylophilus sp. Kf1]|nr:polysaccharide deacetylase family protein [Xylophilus sp. Kf1]
MSPTFRASRFLSRFTDRRLLALKGERGVVSFSFDDAPMSACTTGAEVLERHGVRGTYYIAGGLTDGTELGLPCHSEAALRGLLAAGHQLGAHSFDHVRVDRLDRAARRSQFDRCDAFLESLGVDRATLDFAYPLGAVAMGAKRDSAARYRSARATGGGAHIGFADLNALRSHRLYRAGPDGVDYAQVLAQTAARRGWLVVNTHEVDDGDGPYGCSPQGLDRAVRQALDAGCQVMTVGAALDHWTARAG